MHILNVYFQMLMNKHEEGLLLFLPWRYDDIVLKLPDTAAVTSKKGLRMRQMVEQMIKLPSGLLLKVLNSRWGSTRAPKREMGVSAKTGVYLTSAPPPYPGSLSPPHGHIGGCHF